MKKLLFALLAFPSLALAVDDLATRPDIYGPIPSQWSYSTVSATSTTKSSSGVLNCVNVTSAPANVWSIRDGTSASASVVISTFPASMTPGSYCYGGIATTNGIQVVLPASGLCSITLSYR